jgi:hypothetical protein
MPTLPVFLRLCRSAALRAGLRRKDEGLSFPLPAVETAGYYQSSPAGTWVGMRVLVERLDAACLADKFSGLRLSLAPIRSRGSGQDDRGRESIAVTSG